MKPTSEPFPDAQRAALEAEQDIHLYRLLAAQRAGGSVHREARWSWSTNPLQPRRSGVFDLALSEEVFEEAMKELLQAMATGVVPPLLITSPRSRPAGLEARLPALGFKLAMEQTLMWRHLNQQNSFEMDSRFLRISDEQALDAWVATAGRGFGREEKPELFRLLLAEPSLSFYGLFEDGELVTTVFRHVRGEVAGLHTIATPPELRGRGYATSVTRSALAVSIAEGQRLAVLQASALGRPIYERLGFISCGELRQWAFHGPIPA